MQSANRGKSANILRTIATLFVFLLHGRSYVPKINELPHALSWITNFPAWAGVWIFLFMSGYGVGCGFFQNRYPLTDENGKKKAKLFIKFYIGRFIKIAPLYYLYCLIFEIFSNNAFYYNNPKILLKMLTFTFNGNDGVSGLGHLWYVSIAMQLYLFMPFIYLIIDKLKDKRTILIVVYCLIIIYGVIIRCILINKGYDWYSDVYTNCLVNLDLIALGMLVAEVKSCYKIPSTVAIKKIVWLMLIALVMYNCYIYYIGTSDYLNLYRCILPSAYAVLCGLIMLLSGHEKKRYKNSWWIYFVDVLAKYSYVFYLLHISVFHYLENTLLKNSWFLGINAVMQYVIFFLVSMLLIMILAVPLNCIEEKILKLYRNIKSEKVN